MVPVLLQLEQRVGSVTSVRRDTGRKSKSGLDPGPFRPNSGKKLFAHVAFDRGAFFFDFPPLGFCLGVPFPFGGSSHMQTHGFRLRVCDKDRSGVLVMNAFAIFGAIWVSQLSLSQVSVFELQKFSNKRALPHYGRSSRFVDLVAVSLQCRPRLWR